MKTIFLALLLPVSVSFAQTKKPVTRKTVVTVPSAQMTSTDSLSYSIGVQVAQYYRTQGVEKINADYDGILFFSPGAAESFFNGNNLPSKTTLFAIGKTTSDKLKTLSKNPVITADMPDKLGLVKKAIQHLSATRA